MSADWLSRVYELHPEWLKVAKAYGAGDLAEDFVQDAYLKLYKYATPEKVITGDKVNKGYVFFTIKTIVMQWHETKPTLCDDIPDHWEETVDSIEAEMLSLWESIDKYTQKNYSLPKRILYKMWKGKYNVREIAYCTDVSTPTIVKDLKEIKNDISEKFKEDYKEIKK